MATSKKKVAATRSDTPRTKSATAKRNTAPRKAAAAPRRRGRPQGARAAAKVEVVEVIKSHCPACGSNKTAWSGPPSVFHHDGLSPSGKAYKCIRHTRKRCECGQIRVEKEYISKPRGR